MLHYLSTLILAVVSMLATQAVSAEIIPFGRCTVIVASRTSMTEVQNFMSANKYLSFDAVYESENGWFAVSIGLLPIDSFSDEMAGMKKRGIIPQDSYCSSGRKFHNKVWPTSIAPNDMPPPQTSQTPDGQSPSQKSGSGTGFLIDLEGHVMTNNHVIEDCQNLFVNGRTAKLVAQSDSFDLAILDIEFINSEQSFLSFSSEPALLNSDITVAGFPLYTVLGGLNVTRGSISAMEGLWGDTATMQITAPVQPGNSGGPIVNQFGEVVGIVVSKLDAGLMQRVMGDIPQNVNFGIRGPIGQMFAEMNDIHIEVQTNAKPLSTEELAEKLASATVLIQCN